LITRSKALSKRLQPSGSGSKGRSWGVSFMAASTLSYGGQLTTSVAVLAKRRDHSMKATGAEPSDWPRTHSPLLRR
jgi:hypothetical protein